MPTPAFAWGRLFVGMTGCVAGESVSAPIGMSDEQQVLSVFHF
jgi:hypothetical protein